MTQNERREFLKAAGASLAGIVGMGVVGCTPDTTQDNMLSPGPVQNDAVAPISVQEDAVVPDIPQGDTTPDIPSQDNTSFLTPMENASEDKSERREELIERLKKLGEEEPPKKIEDIGAMCYRI